MSIEWSSLAGFRIGGHLSINKYDKAIHLYLGVGILSFWFCDMFRKQWWLNKIKF